MVEIITYFQFLTPDDAKNIREGQKNFVFPMSIESQLSFFFTNMQRTYPKAQLTLITPHKRFIPPPQVKGIYYHLPGNQLDRNRILALLYFLRSLERKEEERDIFFCDWDIFLNHTIDELFHHPYDLYLPFSPNHYALNTSLIVIPKRGNRKVMRLLDGVLRIVERYPDTLKWVGGSSTTLFYLFHRHLASMENKKDILYHDCNIHFLGQKYYFTLKDEELFPMAEKAHVVHFCERGKKLQNKYLLNRSKSLNE